MNQFFLNGEKYLISYDLTILDLINYFGYKKSLLVVEYNNFICSKKHWNETFIKKNDKVEIVTIVGGG